MFTEVFKAFCTTLLKLKALPFKPEGIIQDLLVRPQTPLLTNLTTDRSKPEPTTNRMDSLEFASFS
jgi:hypothetical protein